MKITNRYLVLFIMYSFSFGCDHSFSQNINDEEKVSNCILLGYDSIAYYYGNSIEMKDLIRGNINDSIFISHIIKSIKEHSDDKNFKVAFKPTHVGDAGKNVVDIINLFNKNDIDNRYMDSLDFNEKKFFKTETMPAVIIDLNRRSLKLNLPGKNNENSENTTKSLNTITIILFNDIIYAYEGKKIRNGKKYSYSDIGNYITKQLTKRSLDDFKIIIEAAEDATYTNTIDILDKMKTNNIEKYTLVGLSNEDEQFIKTLK